MCVHKVPRGRSAFIIPFSSLNSPTGTNLRLSHTLDRVTGFKTFRVRRNNVHRATLQRAYTYYYNVRLFSIFFPLTIDLAHAVSRHFNVGTRVY